MWAASVRLTWSSTATSMPQKCATVSQVTNSSWEFHNLKTTALSLIVLGSSISMLLGSSSQGHAQSHHHHRGSAPTASISASPASLTAGQQAILTWTSTGSDSATLNGNPVATAGSVTLSPTASVVETLVVTSSNGQTATATASINVAAAKQSAPTATISASPSSVTAGQQTTVTWSSANATSATLNGASVAISGSTTLSPTASTVETLVVTGAGGSVTETSNITVATASTSPTGSTATGAPHINYTDLNVGSGSGGDNGNGVYVRIFGSNFGSSQGSSTLKLGGNLVTNCSLCSWTNTAIIAQLGSAASTGNIMVTVNGLASNGVPFTVAPTTIVFVSPNGNDGNNGSFGTPFKTWRAAFNSVTGNDNNSPSQNTVIYLEPGVNVSTDDGRGYSATMSTDLGGSSPTSQLSIVGYPGGTVNVGSTGVSNGVHGWGKNITLADLTIIGQSSAIDAEAGNIRIINNDLSCPAPPAGVGGTACILAETTTPTDTWAFQGNIVHNTGGNVDKTYHAVYFSTGANHADVGWNNIGQNFQGYCRSIMFHASSGANLSDIHVHDNTITGGYCDAIGLASVDPSQGTVEAYNNVISHVAIASNPYGVANEVGIAVNSDPASSTSGTVQIYNNTVVDAGGYTIGNQNGCFGVVTAGAGMNLTNNICSQPTSSEPYIESGSTNVTGSHNLWFGAGAAPSWDSAPVAASPDFVSATNFALQPASPAKHAGTSAITSPIDVVGTQRGNPPSIGAYE